MEAKAQYRIDQWTADNGLPQNSVYSITQTRDGYLWLATVDGLVRFDGVRFTVFNKSNSPGIVNNRFLWLFENAEGSLWAVTEVNYATRLYRSRFTSYPIEMAANTSFTFLIDEDGEGKPLTVANDFRSSKFDGETFSLFDPPPFSPDSISKTTGSKLFQCHTDEPNQRLQCLVRGRLLNFSKADGLQTFRIVSGKGAEDDTGDLWLAFSLPESGLLRFRSGRLLRSYRRGDGLPGEPIFFVPGQNRLSLMSKDEKGMLWLTDLGSMSSELVARQAPEWFGETMSAHEDREGSVWVGTLRGGLFRFRKQFIQALSKTDGLAENNVYPIYEDQKGNIWVGTYRGLYKYANGSFDLVKGSSTFNVYALGETADGRVLVSYYGEIFFLDEQDRPRPFYANPNGINHAIYTDRDGSLWLGGVAGLIKVKDNVAERFTEQEGLAANDVKTIVSDGAGGLWIGSYGGLTHYSDGQFTRWTEQDGLPTPTIRALYHDEDGTLWIGSYDSGLARFKNGKFTHYTTRDGLFNDGAFQILEDGRRNLWIGSNRGIYRLNKDELNEFAEGHRASIISIAYGKSDGMLNVECNGGRSPGGIKTSDGRLWFPTQDGVAVIDPETVPVNTQPPPVVIESVKVDNREVLVVDGAHAIEESSDRPVFPIRIEPSQQNFEIQYTGLSFINSENLRFKYKLDGLDPDWVDAGTRRTAYFSNVPPGEYTFQVVAANADGIWNETGATIPLTVLPPFYRTWWFTIMAMMTVAASIFLIYWWRVSELKRKHAVQAAFSRRLIDSQEQERKRFAAELHDGLGQSLVIVKNLASLGLRQPEDKETTRAHLEKISSTASQAVEETREIAFNLRPHLLDRLGLTRTIESMLDKVFTAGGVKYQAHLDTVDDVFPPESEILFYRVIQECASNIVKHAGAGEAKVVVKRSGSFLRLVVSDNGCGFDTSITGNDLQKRSFGLIGISERTRLLGGRLNIESKPGKGTKVEIDFDL